MKVFLVRHGEGASVKNKWQVPNTPLSRLGERQARALAKRSRFRGIDIIITSEWLRSKKTAEIIANSTGKPLEIFNGIHERKQHPEIYGAGRSNKISKKYYKEASQHLGDLDWKFDKIEESFRDVIKRAISFKKTLVKKNKGKNVLVVSHDIFIRCFIAICLLGEKYKDEAFNKIFRALRIANSGISLVEYDEKQRYWKIWYLNDFSHLKMVKKKKIS